ncbi:MAG TPA: DMT family transporter [Alphaproteobacteria bacterium]
MNPKPAFTASTVPRGIALYLVALFMFACMDALAKYLTRDYHVVQVAWARYVFHAAFLLMLVPRYGLLRPFRSARPGFQLLRASLLMAVTLLFFTAISFIPLADAAAISFVAPLIVTALAFFVLKEHVGVRRWSAICAGFVGLLIVLRPGAGVMHWAAFIALAMATLNACYHLATRMLAGVDSPQTTIFYTGTIGALGFSALAPFFWTQPDAFGWGAMIVLGVMGGLGHYLLIHAYNAAPASTLAPYSYSGIVWATVLGFVVFGDFPDLWTIVGATIIVASGIYVFYREAHLKRTRGL